MEDLWTVQGFNVFILLSDCLFACILFAYLIVSCQDDSLIFVESALTTTSPHHTVTDPKGKQLQVWNETKLTIAGGLPFSLR